MNDLEARVSALSYDDLVEAANFYLPDVVGAAGLRETEERLNSTVEQQGGDGFGLKAILDEVKGDSASVEYLLRTTLLHAANGTSEEQKRLGEALDGVGKSQVIVEVLYAITAATVVAVTWLKDPPANIWTEEVKEKRADGSMIVTTKSIREPIPPPVEKLYGWIKGLIGSLPKLGSDANATTRASQPLPPVNSLEDKDGKKVLSGSETGIN